MSGKGAMKRPRQDPIKNPPSQEEVRLQCFLDLCRQMREIAIGLLLAVTAAEERAKAAEERAKAAEERAEAAEKRVESCEKQIRVQARHIEKLDDYLQKHSCNDYLNKTP
ncbi:MAG: hypothetical protein CMM02_07565 [Rhodopirellula sp.]|nr:hypothetical protein [Rhodopirellula sp.]